MTRQDWKEMNLGGFVSLQRGHDLTASQRRPGDIPVMGAAGPNGFHDTALVKGPGVVLGRSGASFGQAHFCELDFWPHNTGLYVTDFRGNDPLFVFYFLKKLDFSRHNSGGAQPSLNRNFISPIPIRIPESVEQRIIGRALSDVDALIASLDRLIAKKRDLKQAAMQELLTGKKHLPGFSGQWETKRLGALGTFLKGSGVSKDESHSGDLPCIRYGEIYTRHNDYIKAFSSFISRSVAERATRLRRGDILFAGSGETKEDIGKCVAFIDDFEAYAGGDIVILRPEKADSLFLGYYLNTTPINRQKASRGQGDAIVHISASALGAIQGKFPPTIEEQTGIAAVLSDMDAEIKSMGTRREKTRLLKQGMMQELLTGRTRLV